MARYLSDDAEGFESAVYELKRVDHLIYVSLKYTRTVDVLKNIIGRLINTYDFLWTAILVQAERDRKIFEVPVAPAAKCKKIKEIYDDERIDDEIKFYLLLRQINKSEYTSHQEFRRHVTMRATLPNGDIEEINIDNITEHYKRAKDFLEYFHKTYHVDEE